MRSTPEEAAAVSSSTRDAVGFCPYVVGVGRGGVWGGVDGGVRSAAPRFFDATALLFDGTMHTTRAAGGVAAPGRDGDGIRRWRRRFCADCRRPSLARRLHVPVRRRCLRGRRTRCRFVISTSEASASSLPRRNGFACHHALQRRATAVMLRRPHHHRRRCCRRDLALSRRRVRVLHPSPTAKTSWRGERRRERLDLTPQ